MEISTPGELFVGNAHGFTYGVEGYSDKSFFRRTAFPGVQPFMESSEPASMDYRIFYSDHSLLHRLVLWSVCCCRRCSSFARRQHADSLEFSEPASMDYRILYSDHSLRYRSVLWSMCCCRRCSFFALRQHVAPWSPASLRAWTTGYVVGDHSLRYRLALWSRYCCRRCSFFARRQHNPTTPAYSSGTRRNSRVRTQPGCATPSASV
jgi:hypothetical protein